MAWRWEQSWCRHRRDERVCIGSRRWRMGAPRRHRSDVTARRHRQCGRALSHAPSTPSTRFKWDAATDQRQGTTYMTVEQTTQTAQASNARNVLEEQCRMRHCVSRLFKWLNNAPAKPPSAPSAVNSNNSQTCAEHLKLGKETTHTMLRVPATPQDAASARKSSPSHHSFYM